MKTRLTIFLGDVVLAEVVRLVALPTALLDAEADLIVEVELEAFPSRRSGPPNCFHVGAALAPQGKASGRRRGAPRMRSGHEDGLEEDLTDALLMLPMSRGPEEGGPASQ